MPCAPSSAGTATGKNGRRNKNVTKRKRDRRFIRPSKRGAERTDMIVLRTVGWIDGSGVDRA
jgi:hypothetical protein